MNTVKQHEMTESGFLQQHPLMVMLSIFVGFLTPFFSVVTPLVQFLVALTALGIGTLTFIEKAQKFIEKQKSKKSTTGRVTRKNKMLRYVIIGGIIFISIALTVLITLLLTNKI